MSSGESSEVRTDVNDERAAMSVDSGAWNGGFRDGIIEGVSTRTDGFG